MMLQEAVWYKILTRSGWLSLGMRLVQPSHCKALGEIFLNLNLYWEKALKQIEL